MQMSKNVNNDVSKDPPTLNLYTELAKRNFYVYRRQLCSLRWYVVGKYL